MLYREIMDSIMEDTQVEISTVFLKRWLKESEKVEDDKMEETAKTFVDELKWVKIKEQLMKAHKIEITQAEIDGKMTERARSMMMQYGMYDEKYLGEIKKRIAENQNEFYNIVSTVESEKLFNALIPGLNIVEEEIGSEAFYQIIDKKFNNKKEKEQ
jgi:hypothetical protein